MQYSVLMLKQVSHISTTLHQNLFAVVKLHYSGGVASNTTYRFPHQHYRRIDVSPIKSNAREEYIKFSRGGLCRELYQL